MSKAELAVAVAEHFASAPVPNEEETISHFLKSLQRITLGNNEKLESNGEANEKNDAATANGLNYGSKPQAQHAAGRRRSSKALAGVASQSSPEAPFRNVAPSNMPEPNKRPRKQSSRA